MEIKHNNNAIGGVFFIEEDNEIVAELTYDYNEAGDMVLNHTGVQPRHEGKGLGRQLVSKAVEYARNNNLKIVPVCSFVVRLFEIVPEYSDVKRV